MATIRSLTRRRFLQSAAVTAALPWIIPASARGAADRPAPSNRITVGCIGVGGRGTDDMRAFLGRPDAQVTAVCDVDAGHRDRAKQLVEKHYAAQKASGAYAGCDAYGDFRELLARADVDAVMIGTPDHWHVLIAVAAARAGKDIYCEKPLSLTIAEGRTLSDTVRRYDRVFQVGSQLRSVARFRFGCELVRLGRIGKVHTIRVGLPTGPAMGLAPEMPVPPGFDYDFWLGQAPEAPYTKSRCHGTFRYISDYSGGTVTDFGAHDIDLAQWGNGTEYTGPVEVEGRGEFPRDGLSNTATNFRFRCTYADGVVLDCWNQYPHSVKFEGEGGWVYVGRDRTDAEPKSLLTSKPGPGEVGLYESRDHHENFIECVRSRRPTITPVEVGHRSISIPHLANIAMRLERKVRWDPDAERFVGDPEADRMLSRAMRAPWSL